MGEETRDPVYTNFITNSIHKRGHEALLTLFIKAVIYHV